MKQASSGGRRLVNLSVNIREVFTFSWPNKGGCQGASSLWGKSASGGNFER